MQQLHWYKVSTHLFSDPAIRHILGNPNGDTYLVILFYLREIACAACDDGKLSISHDAPLLVRDIARGCGRRRTVIEKALQVFSECGIITIEEETGMIRLTDWDDMQSLCKDEKRREQTRQRVAAYRERKKVSECARADTSEIVAEAVDGECGTSTIDGVGMRSETVQQHDHHAMPRPTSDTTSLTVAYYQKVFGPASALVATRLAELESLWPVDTIVAAIDLAKSRGRGHIRYIEKIIENNMSPNCIPNEKKGKEDFELIKCLAKFRRKELEWNRRRALRNKKPDDGDNGNYRY